MRRDLGVRSGGHRDRGRAGCADPRGRGLSERLAVVSAAERDSIRAGPRDRATHARLLARLPFAVALDRADAPSRVAAPEPAALRAVAWNAQRCRHLDARAALLRDLHADVLLLSELDWGMARSGQRHTARELAVQLDCGYAFGVEFLELDLGDAEERGRHAGAENEVGYHGNAILTRAPLADARLVRLEARGDWFDGTRGERRVGGRCAVLGWLRAAGRAVAVAAVHLDSHGTPAQRAEELAVLLDAIDAVEPGAAALIGGDLNAFSLALSEIGDPTRVAAALRDDPRRWACPVPHEPLFSRAAARGYEWAPCNAPGVATLRHATASGSTRGALKIDWFLARGLDCSAPRVAKAVDGQGRALSDHEPIAVTVRPA
jgi:endonuclease/exonuclease/phosphatase family metal-dependent hydrolase